MRLDQGRASKKRGTILLNGQLVITQSNDWKSDPEPESPHRIDDEPPQIRINGLTVSSSNHVEKEEDDEEEVGNNTENVQ
jgi:hypothetical protein